MAAYLLTWNPKNWTWADLPEIAEKLSQGLPVHDRWSCGNNRSIEVGSRVFLLRQGVEPKGIVASGWTTRAPFPEPHWDPDRAAAGDLAYYIEFAADAIVNPAIASPLDVRTFDSGPLAEVYWDTPASGNSLPDAAAYALSSAWSTHLGTPSFGLGLGDPEIAAVEGTARVRFVIHRARERALRDAKLDQARSRSTDGRLRCEVPGCGFDFEAVYGSIGLGFAHVHHLKHLADSDNPSMTRLADLAVVCANCHAMIHRGGECRPLSGLVARVQTDD